MLLSRLMRTVAITGRADSIDTARVDAFFGGRQGGRWAKATAAAAVPRPAPQADPAETLRRLTELHQRHVVTDAEFEKLRARLRV